MRTKCNKVNTAAEKECNKGQGKKADGNYCRWTRSPSKFVH